MVEGIKAYKYITNYFLQSQVQNKILLGDFNIAYAAADLARPVQNKNNTMFTIKERNAFLYLLKSGFVDAYRLNNKLKTEYTWWPYAFKARKRNIGWRIDYVLLPISLIHKKHKIQILNDIMGSDHCPIMVDIDI